MSVLDSPKVTRVSDGGSWVDISHGQYLVEFDDRYGLWWAFSNGARLRPLNDAYPATDPLACSSDACSGWERPEELIAVLLAFDGEQVPA